MVKSMKRIILLLTAACVLLSSMPAFAAGESFNREFSADNNSTAGFEIEEGYTVSDDGLYDKNLSRYIKSIESYEGKYKYSVEFQAQFENTVKILFNYVDEKNYSYIEVHPDGATASLKTFSDGTQYTGGMVEIGAEVPNNKWVTAEILSNGGREISLNIIIEGVSYQVFDKTYLENGSKSGKVGFEADNNPLVIKSISVEALGAADYIESEATAPGTQNAGGATGNQTSDTASRRSNDIIELMCDLGIMSETENGTDGASAVTVDQLKETATKIKGYYMPENNTGIEVLKMVLSSLHCLFDVSDAAKYDMAMDLGILLKTSYQSDAPVLRYDLAQMIYNVFDQKTFFNEDNYVFSDSLGLTQLSGQVTDNGITALTDKTEVGEGSVIIGGVKLVNKSARSADELLGRMVTAYYNDEYELLHVAYKKNEKKLVINGNLINSFRNGNIYYDVDGSSKEKHVKITPDAAIVLNGSFVASYNESLFTEIENGTVTLIASNRADYDTIIIESYKNFIVASLNADDETINNAAFSSTDSTVMRSIKFKDYDFISISDTTGAKLTVADIKVNDVLSVAASENCIKIIVCRETEGSYTIKSVSEEDGKTVITDNVNDYIIYPSYFKAHDVKEISMGTTYTLMFNCFGDVAWILDAADYAYEIACLLKTTLDTDTEQTILRIYDADGEKHNISAVSKVKFMDENGIVSKIGYEALYEKLKNQNEFIAYKVNNDGQVTEIQMAYSGYAEDVPNKLMRLCNLENKHSFNYVNVSYSFGYKYFFNDVKRMFDVDSDDVSDFENYTVISSPWGIDHYSNPKMKCYSLDSDFMVDYALLYDTEGTQKFPKLKERELVVQSVREILVDGENLYEITGFNGQSRTFYCEPEKIDNAYDVFTFKDKETVPGTYSLKKGDIIKYRLDDGRLEDVVIIYRADSLVPGTGTKGAILGSTDITQNTFKLDSKYELTTPAEAITSDSNRRFIYGWVYKYERGVVTVTTQDLTVADKYYKWNNPSSTEYLSEHHTLEQFSTMTVDTDADTGEVKATAGSTIKSFEKYGNDCSRVLIGITKDYYSMTFIN